MRKAFQRQNYCVQRTNIQNLKAIHNCQTFTLFFTRLCSKNEYTKSESNSQRLRKAFQKQNYCVQRTNIQNLKAIHNYLYINIFLSILCSKNEYTKSESNSQLSRLLPLVCLHCVQRTNIQNLKAIHNKLKIFYFAEILCSKNEYTKSESNSQRFTANFCRCLNCVQRTNIQNLKAIHNEQVRQYDCGQAAGACVVAAEPPSSGMG